MLKSLEIKNFAIIEDLKVQFEEGLTVLTGETGAGKSLLIDTISLLLGQRADSDMIRYGEKKATIFGVFVTKNKKLAELLAYYGLPNGDNLTILREIYDNSRNVTKINDVNVSLVILKKIAGCLADVHIQNDTFKFFDKESYLTFLADENDESYNKLFSEYTIAYAKYLEALKTYESLLKGQKEDERQLEFMVYEADELRKLNLKENLDVILAEEVLKLENYDKIFSALANAYNSLNLENFGSDFIYEAKEALKKITTYDLSYQNSYEILNDCYYQLDEVKNTLKYKLDELDFNQDELNTKTEQLLEIEKAKKKYNRDLKGLMQLLADLELRIAAVENYDQILKEKENIVKSCLKNLETIALKLSSYRQVLAEKLEESLKNIFLALDLDHTQFKVAFNKCAFKENGCDEVDFMISFNKGEPLRPLHKVASGGEMSRIALAFKSYFASNFAYDLLVFDEIDTGVSGQTAKKIALQLRKLSKSCQVLCITHLPQVAALGEKHIHIYKEQKADRTTTHVDYLSFERRVQEVATMLSGDRMSLYALEHARALLNEK